MNTYDLLKKANQISDAIAKADGRKVKTLFKDELIQLVSGMREAGKASYADSLEAVLSNSFSKKALCPYLVQLIIDLNNDNIKEIALERLKQEALNINLETELEAYKRCTTTEFKILFAYVQHDRVIIFHESAIDSHVYRCERIVKWNISEHTKGELITLEEYRSIVNTRMALNEEYWSCDSDKCQDSVTNQDTVTQSINEAIEAISSNGRAMHPREIALKTLSKTLALSGNAGVGAKLYKMADSRCTKNDVLTYLHSLL